jgi:hypothetical protein
VCGVSHRHMSLCIEVYLAYPVICVQSNAVMTREVLISGSESWSNLAIARPCSVAIVGSATR